MHVYISNRINIQLTTPNILFPTVSRPYGKGIPSNIHVPLQNTNAFTNMCIIIEYTHLYKRADVAKGGKGLLIRDSLFYHLGKSSCVMLE